MKKIATCPTCARDIESGDDVAEVKGVVYHEECVPPAEPTEKQGTNQPAPAEPAKEKKMSKAESQAAMIERLVEVVGKLAGEVADLKKARAEAPRKAKPKSEKGAPRPEVYYVLKGYPTEKQPPQCLRVMRALAQAAPADGRMTETDVWNALMDGEFPSTKANERLGKWNHVQTPFYIFKYYRAKMIDAGYVVGPFDVV